MLLSAFALAAFTFPGGAPNAFANKLFEETKQPVIVCQAVTTTLPKLEFDTEDVNSIMAAFRASETTSKMPGVEMHFLDAMVQPDLLGVSVSIKDAYPIPQVQPTADMLKDGKVTIAIKDAQTIRLDTLADLAFSRKLTIHRVLGSLKLALRVEGMEERDFLIKLAKIVGGHLKTTAKEYTLLPYGVEFGKRAEKTLRLSISKIDRQKQAAYVQAVETRIALIRELTETELLEVLDPAGTKRDFSMVRKQRAAAAFVTWLRLYAEERSKSPELSTAPPVDPRTIVWAKSDFRMDTQLNVTAILTVTDPNTRQEQRRTIVLTRSSPGGPGRPPIGGGGA